MAIGARQRFKRELPGSVSLIDGLDEFFEQREAKRENRRTPFRLWAERVPEPKSGTLDWQRYPYQVEMYDALGDVAEGVVMKATQVGMSALTARWALWVTDTHGLNALYVFPTKEDVYDFSDARINGMIDGSDYLRSRIPRDHVDNKGLKKVGIGHCYFRGSNSKRALDSADIDALVLDEYDTLTHKHIPDAERRISGSGNGMIRRIGVPTYPDYGIHKLFMESDRRLWLVQCGNCDHIGLDRITKEPLLTPRGRGWQEIDFFENVDRTRMLRVCAGCAEPLDVSKGRWIPQQDSDVVGFHVTRLIVPETNLAAIVKASTSRSDYEVQTFWNKDLGLPFEPKEGRVSLAVLQAAQSLDITWAQQPGYSGPNLVTMGVDVATTRPLTVRISEWLEDERNRKQTLFLGPIEDEPGGLDAFSRLVEMMDRYQVSMAVIDHEPDGRLARAFCHRFPGRAFICNYSGTQKDVLKVDLEQRRASVNRLQAMDATRAVMARQRNILPQDLPEGYVAEMRAPIRGFKEDELGNKRPIYTSTGPDDYYHAETYDLIARELLILQLEMDEAGREELRQLDEMIPFRRSTVNDLGDDEWSPGPSDEWSPGYDS